MTPCHAACLMWEDEYVGGHNTAPEDEEYNYRPCFATDSWDRLHHSVWNDLSLSYPHPTNRDQLSDRLIHSLRHG